MVYSEAKRLQLLNLRCPNPNMCASYMKRCLLLVFATIFGLVARAQVYPESEYAGTKYLEDQFYVGVGYNFLVEKPKDVVQRGLSYSLQAGFIRDIPLNKRSIV